MQRHLFLTLLLFAVVTPCIIAAEPTDNWTRFRGPNGSGIGCAPDLPQTWTADDFLWRVKLEGIGHGSPVVYGERLIVTSADESSGEQIVQCLRTSDGSTFWTKRFVASTHEMNQLNSYASPTPTTDGQKAYVTWGTPKVYAVVALDLGTGEVVWRRDLGAFQAEHGFGISPILHDDLLIVSNEQIGRSSIVGLDKRTGQTVWQTSRTPSEKNPYGTPAVFRHDDGTDQLVFSSCEHGIYALDPKTGKEQWALPCFEFRTVAGPLVIPEAKLVLAGSGSGGGGKRMFAVEPPEPGSDLAPRLRWQLSERMSYVPMPIACDGLIFFWADSGIASCYTLDGEQVWLKRITGRFFGSPVCVNGRLYCMSLDGHINIMPASREFTEPTRIDLGEPSSATPAVAGGVMYLRTKSHVMALGTKK